MKRWARIIALMEKNINAYRGLDGKYEGNRHLGRARRRWDDDIKIVLKE